MIYGSSQAQSALGSLLRKMSEESATKPTVIPQNAAESSPIRQQIQGPINAPESVGSDKMVSIKPELNPAQGEVVNAMGAGDPINAGGNLNVVGPVVPTVVGPTYSQSGIINPTSSFSPSTPTPSNPNNPSVNNARPTPSNPVRSISTNSLLPSSLKTTTLSAAKPSAYQNLQNIITKSGSITSPTTKPIEQTTIAKGLGSSSFLNSLGALSSRLMLAPAVLGTFMQKSTLNKILQRVSNPRNAQRT